MVDNLEVLKRKWTEIGPKAYAPSVVRIASRPTPGTAKPTTCSQQYDLVSIATSSPISIKP